MRLKDTLVGLTALLSMGTAAAQDISFTHNDTQTQDTTLADRARKTVHIDPQFNYAELGAVYSPNNGSLDARVRSYTTNDLHLGPFIFQHNGFHEGFADGVKPVAGYSRNAGWFGGEDLPIKIGVINEVLTGEKPRTQFGFNWTLFPEPWYGFLDMGMDFEGVPTYTLFAGRPLGEDMSLWAFTTSDLGDIKNAWYELQLNYDLEGGDGTGLGLDVRLESTGFKDLGVQVGVNYTF